MRKISCWSLVLLAGMLLFGCDINDSESTNHEQPKDISTISIVDIISDIESGSNIYDEIDINVSGEYLLNIPSIACDGFCLSPEEILEIEEGDLNFINTFEPYGTNLCDEQTNEVRADGYSIPVVGFPEPGVDLYSYFDCNFSSGDLPIQLSGTLVYTTVKNYCNLIEQPSARLHLDKESVERLKIMVECE